MEWQQTEWQQTGSKLYQVKITSLMSINVYKSAEGTWSADVYIEDTSEFLRGFASAEEAKTASLAKSLGILQNGQKEILSLMGEAQGV